jgi:hypothetical protein
MAAKKQQKPGQVNTEGGAYIGGNVNTGGGDFTGRDKKVSSSGTNINIGGSVNGGVIIIGDGNTVHKIENIFAPVYHAIQGSGRPEQDKQDLTAEVKEIETAIVEGEIEETWLARRLRSLKKMAPEIAEVAFAALGGPGAVAGTIVKKMAEKVKNEG